jgi:NAD(P)-dependent dehydrogenase (short-subunit alcohol dehydrogenase family)
MLLGDLVLDDVEQSAGPDAAGHWLEERIAMRRLVRPEAIATAVLFLASHHAAYITGASVVVDGGMMALV